MKKLLLFLSFVSLTINTNAQWQQTSLDSGEVDAFTIKGDTIFAGTMRNGMCISGYVYLTSDNGNSWSVVNNGLHTNTDVYAFALKGNTIYTGTDYGVYLSSNNGSSWSAVNSILHASDTINGVYALAISGNNIFAGTGDGVFLSSNNGTSWNASIDGILTYALAIEDSNIFEGGGSGIYLSSNNGNSWVDILDTGVFTIAISGSNIYAGSNYSVHMSTNNGTNWVSFFNELHDVGSVLSLAIMGDTIFAGTSHGVFLSLDNGNSWDTLNLGLTCFGIHALAIKGDTIFAGTQECGVFKLALSDITVGVKEVNNYKSNIALYPNPATNNFIIESPLQSTIEITNRQGQTILQQQIQQGKTDIDISGLAKGVYILRLCSDDKTAVARIVKE